jgi:hypothetical protein
LRIPSNGPVVIDAPDRIFHVEVLKGGMNRLLFRSNRTATLPTRIEVFFINVKYLSLGTLLDGLTIRDQGQMDNLNEFGWKITVSQPIRLFEVVSKSGSGTIVAGDVDADESDAGPSDPSGFFMMD